jgi:hypothetical protein
MRTTSTILLALLATACEVSMPPSPVLTVTSPNRGLVQSDTGRVIVTGTALPTVNGDLVTKVEVNGVRANLAADGTFTAEVDVSAGATLLRTVATAETGAEATDARAVHAGQLRAVGTPIERAMTATLSADAFAKLSETASTEIKKLDFNKLLTPMNPIANLGDSYANVKFSVKQLGIGDLEISLMPTDGGLQFSAEFSGLNVDASAQYYVLLGGDTTNVKVTADKFALKGTLVVTPDGMNGFKTTVTSPSVQMQNLRLQANGVVGSILELLTNNLGSITQKLITGAAEKGLAPMITAAFGALAGPKQIDVLGKTVTFEATPAAVAFSSAGAHVTLNLMAKIAGSEGSKGYVYTPNGMPELDMERDVQLGISDDLLNQMIAQVHALGILNYHLNQDFGVFDAADFKMVLPPMISANTKDGSMRLVLGDMTANFTDNGQTFISAAVNAQVELKVERGRTAQEVAIKFGEVDLWVNVFNDHGETEALTGELATAASQGIGVQLDSLTEFMVTVPVPTIAGRSMENLALRTNSGYVLMSGDIR